MMYFAGSDDPNAGTGLAGCFPPGQIDQLLRQAIQFCWLSLPQERRTAEEVEKQVRRLVERALKDFREDAEAFGK